MTDGLYGHVRDEKAPAGGPDHDGRHPEAYEAFEGSVVGSVQGRERLRASARYHNTVRTTRSTFAQSGIIQ